MLGDVSFGGVGQSRNAVTKKFKASKDLHIGDVVIADPGNDGQVTTTTVSADTKVLGIALTDTQAGEDATIAIGGSVQVKAASAAILSGDLLVSSSAEGTADKSATTPSVGSVIGKALGKPDTSNMVWVLVTLN